MTESVTSQALRGNEFVIEPALPAAQARTQPHLAPTLLAWQRLATGAGDGNPGSNLPDRVADPPPFKDLNYTSTPRIMLINAAEEPSPLPEGIVGAEIAYIQT